MKRKFEPYIQVPYYSLSPNGLTLFDRPDNLTYRGESHLGFVNLLTRFNEYGEISDHSQLRLKKIISYMMYITADKKINGAQTLAKSQNFTTEYEKGNQHKQPVTYKLTFVTLTLPSEQTHTDQEIKSLALHQFLNEAAPRWRVSLYVWKAEKQGNGNIHFHILTNAYIPHKELREVWNRIINKHPLNYVDRYSQKMQDFFATGFRMLPHDKRSEAAQRKAYETNRANGWTNPNSTDVHALYKVRNVAAYISKYLSKDVAKTARIEQMKKLIEQRKAALEQKDKVLQSLSLYGIFDETDTKAADFLKPFQSKITAYEAELHTLKKQGISGHIWGCSSTLSKCKNYIACENWSDIPDMPTVAKTAHFYKRTDMGKSSIHTYAFDIQKTPVLKSLLDTHLSQTVKHNLI